MNSPRATEVRPPEFGADLQDRFRFRQRNTRTPSTRDNRLRWQPVTIIEKSHGVAAAGSPQALGTFRLNPGRKRGVFLVNVDEIGTLSLQQAAWPRWLS